MTKSKNGENTKLVKGTRRHRGPTGPRTKRGKRKSRHNAVRHGILAEALLVDEPREEYENLLQGLRESLAPAGAFEELLVEKLAMLYWRYRRLLQAEAARLRAQMHSHEDDPDRRAAISMLTAGEEGLLSQAFLTGNESQLIHGVGLLKKLAEDIKKEGLDWQRDRELLKRLFGREPVQELAISDWEKRQAAERAEPDRSASLVKRYYELTHPGEEAQISTAQARREILKHVENLIATFEPTMMRWVMERDIRQERARIEALVPQGEMGERFLRYEGSLERAIDRTLAQLERLQRLRRGLPVPPSVKVDVT